MAAVAEGAPAAEVATPPEAASSEQSAEEVKKTIISLSELVDLALCTPEPGAVNFNLLRAVLHALVQRLDLVDIKAEILDEDTDNVFSQIMENADKLGLKDLRARQAEASARSTDARRSEDRAESRERRHRSRRSDRSRGESSRRGSAERAGSREPGQERRSGSRGEGGGGRGGESGGDGRGGEGRDPDGGVGADSSGPGADSAASRGRETRDSAGTGGEGATPDTRGDATRPPDPRSPAATAPATSDRRKSRSTSRASPAGGGSSGGEHSDEFEDVRETFCPPDSAGQPDVARSRSLSGQRVSPREGEVVAEGRVSAGRRRPSSSGTRRSAAGEDAAAGGEDRGGAGGRGEDGGAEDGGEERAGGRRLSRDIRSSSDSIGLSSSSEAASSRGGRPGRKATLAEKASERLRRSGRQSAVSITSNIEGTPVLSDYTNLDRLEKKVADIQQRLELMELADMLPKVRELQQAISGSQEDVQGLWQSLQLMKKVDANEEGIDKLTQIIETAMAKLKKVRKHTDRLDKQLADMIGHKSAQQKAKSAEDKKPVTMVDMETKYNEIKSIMDGLMSSIGQESGGAEGLEGASTEQQLRSVGAGIVTWGVLESALENIRGEVKEMSEVNDQALTSVEEQQTQARQQELLDSAAADHTTQVSKVKQLLANLSRLVDKHRALEKRVLQMEEAMGENFSDRVLEQLTLLKASASQIQDLRNKLSASSPGGPQAVPAPGGGGAGQAGLDAGGWSDMDVPGSGGSLGHMITDDFTINLPTLREPSQMDLSHLSDWLNYNKARMQQLETALVSQSEQVRDFGDRLGDQVISFRDKLERVERELAGMLGRITATAQKSGMSREDSQALHDAYAKIQTLQMDVEALGNVSKKIVSDRGQIDDELSMLIRALEELKECKVDRATLDELIETKADRSSVEKKVSSWQFEQACQELSEGLGSMLEKIGSQEVDWARSVDEINADLHRKLDRMELAPLRRYINSRLKNIMTKLNKLIAEDESPDACATRRKIIRNLNCLACDDPKKITGVTAGPNVPLLAPFPPSLGERHQISYRMGDIRRQQQMRCEPYKDLSGQQGVFRSHIKHELDVMTYRGLPHHPHCPLYQNRSPHGRCTCVATRFCGGSHTKITCIDTRQRRVGLGAPLMPFGAAAGQPVAARGSRERVTRTSSAGAQQPPPPAARRPPSRGALPPSSPGPRQVRSTGSGLRQRRDSAAGAGLVSKSAPEFAAPFEKAEGRAEGVEMKAEPVEVKTEGKEAEGLREEAVVQGAEQGAGEMKAEVVEEVAAPAIEETAAAPVGEEVGEAAAVATEEVPAEEVSAAEPPTATEEPPPPPDQETPGDAAPAAAETAGDQPPAPETTDAQAPETTGDEPPPPPETTEAPAETTETPVPETTETPAAETTETPAAETAETPAAETTAETPAPETTDTPTETTETPAETGAAEVAEGGVEAAKAEETAVTEEGGDS